MLSCPAGSSGLGRVLLRRPQVSDALHERGEADDEQDLGRRRVATDECGGGQQSGCAAQAVPGRGARRDAPVRSTSSAVERVGRLPDLPAAQGGRGDVQRVRCGPDSICRSIRVRASKTTDLTGRIGGRAGSVLPDRFPFS